MTRIATAILSALLTTAIPTTVQAGNVDNGDYAINYWTNYAIYPLRCVNYNSQDQIMFSMYEKSYNHCSDSPMGTYVTSVENYINGYIQQMEANAMDGGSEYTYPDMADYVNCTYGEINGAGYYMQVGCNPNSPVGLSVNVYSDEACSSPNDDEIDDGYYENKQQNAPLCNAAWNYKAICDGKCQAMAREQKVREGWNKADKVLLTVLSLFGFGMLLTIIKKRQKMSNKDTLLEQAAISAAGLQQTHILGIFALLILIIVMFALLGLKKITWALLLLLNIVLFAYLMKLTVDGSMKETIIGPDGKIIENDDSEDEEDDEEEVVSPTSAENGAYENPNLPTLS
ncbi:hypothetical protein ACHAXN_007541 [Cyclotella atomus]